MEVGEDVTSLHLFCHELELAEGDLVVLKVRQGALEHATLQPVRCDLCKRREQMRFILGSHFSLFVRSRIYLQPPAEIKAARGFFFFFSDAISATDRGTFCSV